MKVKVLRNLGREFPDYREGQQVEVDSDTAKALCDRGLAEIIGGDVRAVPPKQDIQTSRDEEPAPTEAELSTDDDDGHKSQQRRRRRE